MDLFAIVDIRLAKTQDVSHVFVRVFVVAIYKDFDCFECLLRLSFAVLM